MRKYVLKKPNLMTMSAWAMIILSLSIFVLLTLFKLPKLEMWYEEYLIYLNNLEIKIATLNGKWIILLSIFFMFALKALVPIPFLPLSCVCVISGMVFLPYVSLIINILGLVLIFSIRYYIGTKRKTIPYKILKSYEDIWKLLRHDGSGNPWLLFGCRLIPLFPINTVSNIYGSMKYDYKKYLIISVLGFLPKLVSYLIIGHNAFNPFSASFLLPIMILCLLAGIGLLITRKIILIIRTKGEEDVKGKN